MIKYLYRARGILGIVVPRMDSGGILEGTVQ